MSSARGSLLWLPLIAVVILCYGLAGGVWKHASIDVASFCLVFVVGKGIVAWGLWAGFWRRPLIDRASLPFLGATLFAGVLNGIAWSAYLIAFVRGPLALVQAIAAMSAVVAAVLGVACLSERFGTRQWLGVALVLVAGVVLANSSADTATASDPADAWFWPCLLSACVWGASVFVCKLAHERPESDDTRMNVGMWAGLLLTLLPYAIWLQAGTGVGIEGLGMILVVVALYVIGDVAYYMAIRRGPVSLVTPFADLYPIVSAAYALLLLGESPNRMGWIGFALALPGILLVIAPIHHIAKRVAHDAPRH